MPSESNGPLLAANWLRDRANQDEDIKLSLHAAYVKFGVSSISELDPDFVVALYETWVEADLDIELMEEADTDTRERMAKVLWTKQPDSE
jgi:hypothetical protein